MAGEWMAVPQSVLKPLAQNRPKSWNPLLSFKQRQKRTNELVLPRPRILYELTASAVTHSSPRLGIYT